MKIAIGGNIGVGKTTLVKNLYMGFENTRVYKETIDNEFLLLDLFHHGIAENRSL